MKNKLSKKEATRIAKDEVLQAISKQFYCVDEDPTTTQQHKDALRCALDIEMQKLEKRFGYDVGSWLRG